MANGMGIIISLLREVKDTCLSKLKTTAKESTPGKIEETVEDNNAKLVSFATEVAKIGEPKSGAEYSTIFGAIEANAGGGGGGSSDISPLVAKFIEAGVSVPTDASAVDLALALNDYIVLIAGNTTFSSDENLECLGDAVLSKKVVNLVSSNATAIQDYRFLNYTSLKEVICYNVLSVGLSAFSGSTATYINLPKATSASGSAFRCNYLKTFIAPNLIPTGDNTFYGASNLIYANLINTTGFVDREFNGCVNLIDLVIGAGITSSVSLSKATYSPTNAISATSSSLVFAGESFANNREKWNYNLREHFAANLTDLTGLTSATITFGSTLLAAMEDETIAAFTDKNWTLA